MLSTHCALLPRIHVKLPTSQLATRLKSHNCSCPHLEVKVSKVGVVGICTIHPTWATEGTLPILTHVECCEVFDDLGLFMLQSINKTY